MKLFFKTAKTVFWIIFRLCYGLKIEGTENLLAGRAIIAPNHTSYLDPPLMAAACPEEIHFLARASLFSNNFFKFLISQLNAHPVHGSAQDLASFKLVCQLLEDDKKVVIFPEGSRSENGNLGAIKSGIAVFALRTKSPIVPTYIHGAYAIWPRSRRYPKSRGHLACLFGKPILIEPYLKMDKKKAQEAIAQDVYQAIKDLQQTYNLTRKSS